MKTVQILSRRGWLAAVIGVLGIIGGARQQVWAGNIPLPQPVGSTANAGTAGIFPASVCFLENPAR